MRRADPWRAIALALAALLAVAVVVLLIDEKPEPRMHAPVEQPTILDVPPSEVPVPEAVAVDGGDRDTKVDDVIELDDAAQEVAATAATNENLDVNAEGDDLRGKDNTEVGEPPGPLASPHVPGCATRILPTNYSYRTATVKAIGLHYTAGPNRPGLSDMDGLTAYASSSSAGVSWHFLIDAEGHCYYSVPLDRKAWTIGNLNSETVNFELIGTGSEPTYPAGTAGARKLADVVKYLTTEVYPGIPVRVGAVSNCTITRPGIVTHWQGGACAGGHHDIRPYELEEVVAALRRLAGPVEITDRDRRDCRAIVRYRKRRKGNDKAARRAARKPVNQRRQHERQTRVHDRGLYCTADGEARRKK
jgi:hypothetical protein